MAGALAAVAMLAVAPAAAADTQPPGVYRQAVQQAYDLIQGALPADTSPAQSALAVLAPAVGAGQPEITGDLSARPPDYGDARQRLLALLASLDQPARTVDPALAQSRLRDVLSMSRYDPLHRPPSLVDRFLQWIRDRVNDFLQLLASRGLPPLPGWYLILLGLAVLAVLAVIVFRSTRGRLGEAIAAVTAAGPRPPADYFSEADRLAAKGDRVGAIRALCAGVAATLAGARTWEGSPLTVREIFQRAPDARRLRPLLLPFEAAVYGGREVDEPTYARAFEVAAAFRPVVEVAA